MTIFLRKDEHSEEDEDIHGEQHKRALNEREEEVRPSGLEEAEVEEAFASCRFKIRGNRWLIKHLR